MNPLELNGAAFLLFYAGVLACEAYGAYMLRQMMLSQDKDPEVTAEAAAIAIDPYEAAYMLGGIRRVIGSMRRWQTQTRRAPAVSNQLNPFHRGLAAYISQSSTPEFWIVLLPKNRGGILVVGLE